MKQTLQMDNIQRDMLPGAITRDGLLGADRRKLIEILIDDDECVKRLGSTHHRIARRMNELTKAGCRGLGNFITIRPHFEVRVDSVRGKLPCPFGHCGLFAKTNTTIRNLEANHEITYTDLNIHMIETHGFYEGKGASFRLEPADLIDILELPVE
jgi:hypothetical protein